VVEKIDRLDANERATIADGRRSMGFV